MYKFKVEIRKSDDDQFYAVMIGKNGEVVFTGETKTRKAQVKKLINYWFPQVELIDTTKLEKRK